FMAWVPLGLDSRPPCLDQGAFQGRGKIPPLIISEELSEQQLPTMSGKAQLCAPVRPFAKEHAGPERVELKALSTAAGMDTCDNKLLSRDVDQLEQSTSAVV